MRALMLFAIVVSMTVPMTAQVAPAAPPVNRHVRPVLPPPVSARPSSSARPSTAQGAAARGNLVPLKELPQFTVTTRDGLAVSSQTLTQKTHWLLVYRRDKCVPCDRLMNVLAAGPSVEPGQGQAYAIVVAGQDRDGLDKVRAGYSSLTNATWVGDSKKQVIAALKPRGAPMLYGMDGTKIAWTVPGNLGNPALVERMASAWVASGNMSTASSSPAATAK